MGAKRMAETPEEKPKHAGGRPTKYDPSFCEKAKRYALLGLTDIQMAATFDVCEATFYNWKKEHPEFLEAIKSGGVDADGKVVNSLYKRANGFVKTKDVMVNGEVVTLEEEVPPDPASMFFWLKNRQPQLWREKQELDHQSSDRSMTPTRQLSTEELMRIASGGK